MVLSDLDERTVAIEFELQNSVRVVKGLAHYRTQDAKLGPYLAVVVIDETGEHGRPELMISEASWSGPIERDIQHGCEFRLRLASIPRPHVA